MLKIFTVKFEEKIESFNDSIITNFLSDKVIIKWESQFFERKNCQFWTVIVEYVPTTVSGGVVSQKTAAKKEENYKEILTETDWPLFKRLKEWREETSKAEGVPPYIVFTNLQLAKIAVTRPESLNSLQQIEGVGNVKREKYGKAIINIVMSLGKPLKTEEGG
jgi:superfamily II DNA helicase RecQ